MNLIVAASLSEPPTEALFFRHVTYLAHRNYQTANLLEVESQFKDLYYKFLLKQGLMDDIDEIITPEEHLSGLRLANTWGGITGKNYIEILGLIEAFVHPK